MIFFLVYSEIYHLPFIFSPLRELGLLSLQRHLQSPKRELSFPLGTSVFAPKILYELVWAQWGLQRVLTPAPPLCHAHQRPDCPDQITWVFNKKTPLFQRFHGFFFYLEAFLALFSRGEKSRKAFVLILLQFILLQSPP